MREARLRLGLTQRELGRRLGLDQAVIKEWQEIATAGDYDWLLVAAMGATV